MRNGRRQTREANTIFNIPFIRYPVHALSSSSGLIFSHCQSDGTQLSAQRSAQRKNSGAIGVGQNSRDIVARNVNDQQHEQKSQRKTSRGVLLNGLVNGAQTRSRRQARRKRRLTSSFFLRLSHIGARPSNYRRPSPFTAGASTLASLVVARRRRYNDMRSGCRRQRDAGVNAM